MQKVWYLLTKKHCPIFEKQKENKQDNSEKSISQPLALVLTEQFWEIVAWLQGVIFGWDLSCFNSNNFSYQTQYFYYRCMDSDKP